MRLIFDSIKLLIFLQLIIKSIESSNLFANKKQLTSSPNLNIIYLNEKSTQTVRLKSVLTLNKENVQVTSNNNNSTFITQILTKNKVQKIFWSFKRVYSQPLTNGLEVSTGFVKTQNEVSQLELMISLDSEVQDNLKQKYSISEDENNNFDLIISNLTYADSGLYKCNLWNQKTIFYHLTVYSPVTKPEIIIEKSTNSNMINENSNITLKCISRYSYPYPTIKWYKNNMELSASSIDSVYKLIDKETNTIESTFKLNNVNSSLHTSNMTCKLVQPLDESPLNQVLNEQQQLWQSSEQIMLNIAFKPIVTLEILKMNLSKKLEFTSGSSLSRVYLYENDDDIQFTCKFKSNPAQPIGFKWLINNQIQNHSSDDREVFSWKKRSILNSSLNRINLTCEVENLIGKGSLTLDITILYEPRIKIEKQVYDIDESSPFQLNCSIDSSPLTTQIEWRKLIANQTQADYSIDQIISNNSMLEFKSVKHKENSGIYECIGLNLMNDSFGSSRTGQSKKQIELDIRFVPLMNVVSKKQASNLSLPNHTNQKQNISCITMSNPRPEFNWYKNGVKLNSNNGFKYQAQQFQKSKNLYESILTINSLDEFDLNKKYECEAFNQLGSNRVDIELVPLSKPDSPTELRALYVDFMTITLAWSAGFDGGIEQTFLLQLNNSLIELNKSESKWQDQLTNAIIIKSGNGLVNITNLNFKTMYSIRLMAKNRLGNSEWSDYVLVRTSDIDDSDRSLLPVFDSLFLNVPKNRLEFEFNNNNDLQIIIPLCLNITISENENLMYFKKCLLFNSSQNQYLFDTLDQHDLEIIDFNSNTTLIYNSKLVKLLKVSVCFRLKPSVCSIQPFTAIIDTYNKISHSSLISSKKTQKDDQQDNEFDMNKKLSKFLKSSSNTTIPLALIIGISVCILTLIILLFVTIIYCIRKRNFKLCKALLSQADAANNGSKGNTNKPIDSEKLRALASVISESNGKVSHTNKSFNIDIASISAPVASTVSISGSQLTNSTSSDLNSNLTHKQNALNTLAASGSTRRTFSAALTHTANNIINNSIGRTKINEILVTEDEDQQTKILNRLSKTSKQSDDDMKLDSNTPTSNTSSTAVSNCSSSNNQPFIFTDYTLFDQQLISQQPIDLYSKGMNFMETCASSGGGSTGSNSDPIAINNSLSSNSTTDSPIYGYNIAGATNAHNLAISGDMNTNSELIFKQQQQQYVQSGSSSSYHVDEQKTAHHHNYNRQSQPANLQLKHQKHLNNNNKNNKNSYLGDQPPESGYSTPSRPKKVVYEVIV